MAGIDGAAELAREVGSLRSQIACLKAEVADFVDEWWAALMAEARRVDRLSCRSGRPTDWPRTRCLALYLGPQLLARVRPQSAIAFLSAASSTESRHAL